MRIGLALTAFWRILTNASYADQVRGLADAPAALPAPAPEPVPPPPSATALLALLQREGRLVDFLREAIDEYADDQVGAAVREIHKSCRKVLDEHVELVPVIDAAEESTVTVEPGFDPSAIQLSGRIEGAPPFKGTLMHHGWRVARLTIAERPAGQDPDVIAPAEVEVG